MRRTLLLLTFSAVLLSALPVLAQPVSNNAQRIVQTDGTHIDAASPLPITGTVTATMGASTQLPATLGAKAPGASLSVTQDTTGGWTATTTATEDKGAWNVSATTIRVVPGSIDSGTSNQIAVDASEVVVLAAKAGRRFARVQVYSDTDGGVCCALGATTNACADGILLDASPAAGKAGGSAEWEGYGGAITCRAAGAWTTTVATEEW